MYFCPFCGTLLLVEYSQSHRLFCSTCRFIVPITTTLTTTHDLTHMNKPAVEAESPNEESKEGETACAQVMTVRCQSGEGDGNCTNDKAFYVQLQMRSADEAETTFFRCTVCGFQWRQ